MSIASAEIRRLIPHAGAMCLLEEVLLWDADHVVCRTNSHLSPSNPLRDNGCLLSVCGIEYGAQAMAIHSALLSGKEVGEGYLASVRTLRMHVDRLDRAGPALVVEARRLAGGSEGLVYEFELRANDQILVDGRATVALRSK